MTDTTDLRDLADRPRPVITIDGAYDLVYDTDNPVREVLRDTMQATALQYATHLGATAAGLLRQAFGPAAHRAVFNRGECDDRRMGCVHLDLLVVFDADARVIWYDRDDGWLSGGRLVAGRDELEAYGDPMPALDDDTRQAIQNLAEKAAAAHGEYLSSTTLIVDRGVQDDGTPIDLHYDGDLYEMDIDDEPARLRRNAGEPADDDSIGPQRRPLSPAERGLLVRVLHDLITPGLVLIPDVRMFSGDREVLAEAARVLDPRDRVDLPPDHQPGYISLAHLEALLRQETSVIAEEDVPLLMVWVRATALYPDRPPVAAEPTPASGIQPRYVLIDKGIRSAMAVAENGGDLVCAELDAAGRPDWSDASLADPRGLTDAQWRWCGRVVQHLRDLANNNPFDE